MITHYPPRPRRRSRQRGAILIESLIVCSMLILTLICGLFLHRLYAAKLFTIREARVQVWQAVNSPGCGGATIDLQAILAQAIAAIGGPSAAGSDVITPGTAGGSTNRPAFMGAIAHRTQSSSSSVSAHADMGGGTYQLKVVDQLACNELVASSRGDVLSVFGFAAKNLLGAVW